MEFQRFDVLNCPGGPRTTPQFEAWRVELDVLRALEECAALTEDGLLPLPVMVGVSVLDVAGARLQKGPGDWMHSDHVQQDRHV